MFLKAKKCFKVNFDIYNYIVSTIKDTRYYVKKNIYIMHSRTKTNKKCKMFRLKKEIRKDCERESDRITLRSITYYGNDKDAENLSALF